MNPFLSRRVQEGLVLASASPRRREILSDLGFEFEVLPSVIREDDVVWTDPPAAAAMLAALKAEDVRARRPMKTIIAADTVVVCEGRVLGKPSGREEAAGMLRELSGKGHEVITGVALCAPPDHRLVEVERTAVFFRDLSEGEIAIYSGPRRASRQGGRIRDTGARFDLRREDRRRLSERRGASRIEALRHVQDP